MHCAMLGSHFVGNRCSIHPLIPSICKLCESLEIFEIGLGVWYAVPLLYVLLELGFTCDHDMCYERPMPPVAYWWHRQRRRRPAKKSTGSGRYYLGT